MESKSDADVIRALEERYASATEAGELDEWLAAQFLKSYYKLHEKEAVRFKYKDALVVYIPRMELIQFTISATSTGESIGLALLLSQFLAVEYGIQSLHKGVPSTLRLAQFDFELLGCQVSNQLLAWYQNLK